MPTSDLRLTPVEARARIRTILEDGEVVFRDPYFSRRMDERKLTRQDVLNTLRAGIVEEPESENGEWRYRVRTQRITVVVCFPEEMLLATCTCWRNT